MSYKKIFALFCLMLCMTSSIFAQDNYKKNTIKSFVFNNLTYQKPEKKAGVIDVLGAISDALLSGQVTQQQTNYQEALRASIIQGISRARRTSIADGLDVATDYYIDGTVSNISTTSKVEELTDSKGKKYNKTWYKAMIGVTLHIKNAATNKIEASPSFTVSDYDLSWVETADGALNSALKSLSNDVLRYFDRLLPLYADIIEGASEKKDKQKEVYIDLGTASSANVGMHFNVYLPRVIAGKDAKRLIGRLKIKEVLGKEISLCKVQSGGKDIKDAIERGEQILVESTD